MMTKKALQAKRERRHLRRKAVRRAIRPSAGQFGGYNRVAARVALGMRELGRGIAYESVGRAAQGVGHGLLSRAFDWMVGWFRPKNEVVA